MFITILAHIIVFLGVAALGKLIIKIICFTLKKFLGTIREWLGSKVGGTVIATKIKGVAETAIKEAKEKGNTKTLKELEELAESGGVIMASADSDGNVDKDSIKIYTSDEMDQSINNLLDAEEDGVLVVTA